ncbi:WAT1-related protein At3g28050 [Linum grandiflorum]
MHVSPIFSFSPKRSKLIRKEVKVIQKTEMAGAGVYVYRDVLAFSVMVSMECINVGLNTLFKAATMEGMSYHVFVVYAYAIAALVLLPAPFFSHRSRVLPPLNFRILCKIGLLGIIGSSSQIMGYTGINYSSPTLASAISNLTPAFTFILALLFRMEKVVVRRTSSQAKVMGTIVSIAGAFVVTLYKGPAKTVATSQSAQDNQSLQISTSQNWVLGGIFLTCEYILVPLWYIVQTQIMKEYPAELTVVFFYNLVVTMVAAVVALIAEGTSSSAWILRPNVALASVFCSGLLGSCLNNSVHTWALRIKGPVFVAMFKPLSIAIAVAMGVMFLGDTLHLGSLIGAAIISIGFYTVMWGKAQEEEFTGDDIVARCSSSSSQHEAESTESAKAPLLQNYRNEQKYNPPSSIYYAFQSISSLREVDREMAGGYLYRDVLPFSALVLMNGIGVGLSTLFKAATTEGLRYHVFVAYIHAIGALLLLPAHFFSHRSRVLPPLSFPILCKIGLLGVIGSSSQMMGYSGINYSSPTLSSAISNIAPAITFLLALTFRMEKVVMRKRSSQGKVIGAMVSIAGAIVVTLYKGPALTATAPSPTSENWILGGVLLTCEFILLSIWFIGQTQILKEYPAELTVVILYDLVTSIVAASVALVTEGTSASAWILRPNLALASVFCSGILGPCLTLSVNAWALRMKGPVYVAMFGPLSVAIALALGVMFLGDRLHLGSLVGAAIILFGFYTMMWGKAQEEELEDDEEQGENCIGIQHEPDTAKAPLLKNYTNELVQR